MIKHKHQDFDYDEDYEDYCPPPEQNKQPFQWHLLTAFIALLVILGLVINDSLTKLGLVK